ncbi:hypothetical protein EVAR_60450_1 [Eumeta japonica]|uniref:Uncharacterized protein n=1 Tax=Eumeta variegata TaxID=151549 RepID=A0A4C1Z0T8_EUMVA|nr:hypothetical protein EVAR_60450_1 [Eumeta japonica]
MVFETLTSSLSSFLDRKLLRTDIHDHSEDQRTVRFITTNTVNGMLKNQKGDWDGVPERVAGKIHRGKHRRNNPTAYRILRETEMPTLAQTLTGHGGFAQYLDRFKLKSSLYCPCDRTKIRDTYCTK